MIHSVTGILSQKSEEYAVVQTGGLGMKLYLSKRTLTHLPPLGDKVTLFAHLHLKEDGAALYGFLDEAELSLFERLNAISGIGPKSALGILSIAPVVQLISAINEGRSELMTRVSGVGKKTADRVVLELKGKLSAQSSPDALTLLESDAELEETLVSLGYTKNQAKAVIGKIDPAVKGFKARLKEALRLSKK
jgi:holliday junction DNA helicase RuvA